MHSKETVFYAIWETLYDMHSKETGMSLNTEGNSKEVVMSLNNTRNVTRAFSKQPSVVLVHLCK